MTSGAAERSTTRSSAKNRSVLRTVLDKGKYVLPGFALAACQSGAGSPAPVDADAIATQAVATLDARLTQTAIEPSAIPPATFDAPTAKALPTIELAPAATQGVIPTVETQILAGNYPTLEMGGVSPVYAITGVPTEVNIQATSDFVPNNGKDKDGNDHTSKLGQFTGIASPGAYNYDGNRDSAAANNRTTIVRDIDTGVCSVQGSDTRNNFGDVKNKTVPINEGTFREVETAGGHWIVHTPTHDINIDLKPQENHAWMLVVKGLTQDNTTPNDRNISLELVEKDAFSNSTMTGKGTFMSQDMVDQIAGAMHKAKGASNSSGADGSKLVNIFYVDANTGSWSVFEVNYDEQGNIKHYSLVATNSHITP